jgi:hypothetical protein
MNNHMKKIIFSFLALSLVFPCVAFGQSGQGNTGNGQINGQGNTGNNNSGITITNPIGANSFTELLERIVNWLINIGGVIAVAMVIYGALQMILAAGKPENFKKGKQTVMYAVIGYAIILIGWGITKIIQSILSI